MTTISQYLNCEQVDRADSASFYLPGVQDWTQLRGPFDTAHRHLSIRARNGRNSAIEKLYPTPDFQEAIEDGEGNTTS
jgi:hypothetical protein